MKEQQFDIPCGDSSMKAQFSDLAMQSNGSVILSQGDTSVLAVVVEDGESPYGDGGLALRVDYEERYYARGAILGGRFNKREGKPTTEATLTARIIDRSIRPYFPKGYNKNVQVVVTVLSLGEYDPDVLAINAASLSLHTSDIPWQGPVGAVRITSDSEAGKLLINPRFKERKQPGNLYNSIVSGTSDKLGMIECDGAEVSHEEFLALSQAGIEQIGNLVQEFEAIRKHLGKEKMAGEERETPDVLEEVFVAKFRHVIGAKLEKLLDKETVNFWKSDFRRAVKKQDEHFEGDTDGYFDAQVRKVVREAVVQDGERLDGRTATDLRGLYAQAGGLVGRQHGTGVFYRGDTHVLSVVTLGSIEDDVLYHYEMEVEGTQRWMHYYNFPDYSVGEVGPMRSPKRREIGHGALAQKAIERVLPNEDDFPYAIRAVSEVMSSNGSTSMASTCATSLALMDAGVPLEKHVAGVACGLVEEGERRVILVDILGAEDHYGDMDFKIAGTRDGITAVQLDCKNEGISIDTIRATLEASHAARIEILETMEEAIPASRELAEGVERIATYQIPEDKIGLVIGKGGATIKRITRESEAEIDIKRDGTAHITGSSEAAAKAQEMIEEILKSAE